MMEIRANQLDQMDVNPTGLPIFVKGEVTTTRNNLWDVLDGKDVVVVGFDESMPCVQQALLEIKEHKTFFGHPINWKTFTIKS